MHVISRLHSFSSLASIRLSLGIQVVFRAIAHISRLKRNVTLIKVKDLYPFASLKPIIMPRNTLHKSEVRH